MNKLPKEKRDRIVLVCIGTGALLAAVYFFLIGPEYAAITQAKIKTANAKKDLEDKITLIRQQGATENELREASAALTDAEQDIAFGDPNAWFYERLRNFKEHYAVEFSSYGQPSVGNVDLLPHLPYKQLKTTVTGTAFYHDLGKFIADFENAFPHMRLVNLTIEPANNGNSPSGAAAGHGDNEKLAFKMDIVTLVKTAETPN